MSNISEVKHVLCRDGVYYYVRRVPIDVSQHYSRDKLYFSLRTKSYATASRAAESVSQKLETYWMGLRLQQLDIPQLTGVANLNAQRSSLPSLSDAKGLYIRLKGTGKNKTFFHAANRGVRYVSECLGDRSLDLYSSQDAAKLRDWLLDRGLTVVSVKRTFATIRSMVNLCIRENGLDCKNAFSATYMPEPERRQKRQPIPIESIKSIQSVCYEMDDDLRHIIALISDTGMRLAEAVGLKISDLRLDKDIPYVAIQPHPHRPLKTSDSERHVPLVGASLWAAERIIETSTSSAFAFPRYTDAQTCNSNSASAALNKWIKPHVPDSCVIHSFRHSMRDRLRGVECPTEVIDQLGGWAKSSVGSRYGRGLNIAHLNRWIRLVVI